jgi:hypothetical protein
MLVQRILDNDKATARLGAWGMQKGLNRRLAVVAGLLDADGKDWRGLVAQAAAARKGAEAGDPAKAKELAEAQDQIKQWLKTEAVELKLDEHLYISGLSLVDRAGYMLISVQKDDDWEPSPDFFENGTKRNWAWRDWFSGGGNRDESAWYPPVQTPRISQPYRSTDNDVEKVELTVPVTIGGNKDPIAVLVATMKWADMSAWLKQLKMQQGQVVVFNERGQFLMHGDRNVLESVKTYHDDAPRYDTLAAALPKGENTRTSFEDPIDQQQYYIGYKTFDPYSDAEVGDDEPGADGRWGVVVQHAQDDVLKPIKALYWQLAVVGVCTLIGAAVFTAGVWACLIWLLRREERLGHG